MINFEFIYLLPCLISFIASIIGFFAFKRFAKTISIASSVLCILSVIVGFWEPTVQNNYLYVDNLSKVFSLMISIVYLSVVIFSIEYINHIENKLIKVHQYFSLLNIFVSALFASVVLNNLGLIWVGIEATTFTSALLVS
ncbi:MAG: hydrogenase 4 subunit B, partial [Thermodesulfobium narugense]